MTPHIDLHALANAPHGMAEEVLTKAGLMLPKIPDGHRFYSVKVSVTISKSAEVELIVAAADVKSAKAYAEEYGEEAADGFVGIGWETDEVEAHAGKPKQLTPAEAGKEAARLRQPIEVAD